MTAASHYRTRVAIEEGTFTIDRAGVPFIRPLELDAGADDPGVGW